eukprot:Phypoly_transcript_13323.p1 GENE.Phypoly_transcript_13323~~Phypoly_transcript_13323.p1  ORF type:complete len:175 (+),score=22.91 Phypoly_transcript_13323:28-525(+)
MATTASPSKSPAKKKTRVYAKRAFTAPSYSWCIRTDTKLACIFPDCTAHWDTATMTIAPSPFIDSHLKSHHSEYVLNANGSIKVLTAEVALSLAFPLPTGFTPVISTSSSSSTSSTTSTTSTSSASTPLPTYKLLSEEESNNITKLLVIFLAVVSSCIFSFFFCF